MSETVDRRSSITSSIKATPPKQSGGVLKKLAANKEWVSPFRLGNTRNWHKDLQDLNNIDNIEIPKKFTSHPALDAKKKEKAAEVEDVKDSGTVKDDTEDDGDAEEKDADVEGAEGTEAVTDETVAEDALIAESERPLSEAELHEISSKTEDEPEAEAEQETEKEPTESNGHTETAEIEDIDIVTEQPESKSKDPQLEAIEAEREHILGGFKDEPVMLSHYSQLEATASKSVDKKLSDPNRVVNLGAGLKMTNSQIMAIAAQRVAPMLANINQQVSKTREEDELLRQEKIATKIQGHEKKLEGIFEKHVLKIGKSQAKFDKEIETQLLNLDNSMKNAEENAQKFHDDTKAEIQQYKDDYAEREEKAVSKHEDDKETLIKNHEELTATKQQELEDAKQGQIDANAAIEELNTKKEQLLESNSGLNSEIEEIESKLAAKLEELEDLKASHEEKRTAIAANISEREEINNNVKSSEAVLAEKKKKHGTLAAEVGVLAATLAAYGAKLSTLGSDKTARSTRLTEAKEHYNKWEAEKQEAARQVELEHLRQRKEAEQEVETKRIKAEQEAAALAIEEEAKRKKLEEETETKRLEEEERRKQIAESEETKKLEEEIARKKQEHEDAIKAEEERLAQIQKEKELEEELKRDPEYQRELRIQKRDMEKLAIIQQREEYEAQFETRKLQTEKEAEELRLEIEELKHKQTEKAEADRLEAERLAQLKLEEIDKLKKENEERMKIYESRIELENLQRTRLLEEVDHLKKIRELREEKARLAAQTVEDNKLSHVQKLIEERELEVDRLTRQIEMDDDEFYAFQAREKAFLGKSNDFAAEEPLKIVAPSSEGAREVQENVPSNSQKDVAPVIIPTSIPQSKSVEQPSPKDKSATSSSQEVSTTSSEGDANETPKKRRKSLRAALGFGGATAAIGGATAAAVAKTNSVIRSPSKKSKRPSTPETPRSEVQSKAVDEPLMRAIEPEEPMPKAPELKSEASELDEHKAEAPEVDEPKINAPERDEPKITRGNSTVSGKTESDVHELESDNEWETISVYEEVSSQEWDENRNDPNYLEVTQDEFEKKQKKVIENYDT
ncbi:uncharacterized protein KQ657_000973 [Scheffersomyces spartinae]|uniref:Uncharacterized protein n=1 Tax=Scheffersomyces spartinae TaxID=45513 RepID=A0A9P7V894_9ASCO|nr:uncharacterized protein KQ657_000973 [Scheffersomyces spartinae]KAG7193211.1 hypothetical protein KQ657_000973 [Scheffersomyces spartinae]